MKNPLSPIYWNNNTLFLLDQRKLPFKEVWIKCDTSEKVARAIENMTVRGAPAIGVTSSYGVVLAAYKNKNVNNKSFQKNIEKAIERLWKTRPTAVNLFWSLERMRKTLKFWVNESISNQILKLEKEALQIHEEDKQLCLKLARHGSILLKKCKNVLTHCNAGALATGGIGTAIAVITEAAKKNKNLHVWVDETRPYLQGARLTAFEMDRAKINFHLITDNMAAFIMKQNKVDAVIVGADRIAANGDTANKIGTYSLAVLAKEHKIPFYVIAPSTTLDLNRKNGSNIKIEERNSSEVTQPLGFPITKQEYPAYNPSFDITPGLLITAIVLEKGICRPPFEKTLKSNC